MKHKLKIFGTTILLCLSFNVFAQFAQPFKWDAKSEADILTVSVVIPPHHYLYADKRTVLTVSGPDGKLKPELSPKFIKHTDDFGSGDVIPAGKQVWKYKIKPEVVYKVHVEFQGCKENLKDSPGICFMPSDADFKVLYLPEDKILSGTVKTADGVEVKSTPVSVRTDDDVESLLDQFSVINTGGGYLNKNDFIAFLAKSKGIENVQEEDSLAGKGAIGIILLVLLGGLALNLTPCVLPMIPINLAIIGAGKTADNHSRGFLRGGVYGIGIAIAYGLLGLITVLSGAKVGTLNSLFWFNFIVSAVFVVLALAMFDVFTIDFTRFSTKIGVRQPGKGELIPVFVMGLVAALLAGACVAPVVIAVLLYSTKLYADGNITGLILPFVLGLGMALPWPFAGAGIALIPKPGKWMVRVKQFFGVMILLFAAYYAYLGITLIPNEKAEGRGSSFVALKEGLLEAKVANKPVFIDFWATWCKNCSQMEKSTFKDPEVIKKLEAYVFIKFQAEQPNQPEIKKLMDRYKLIGLPGYVILKPKK